ncbi:MAG: hypothetical protein AAFO04_21360 [Cyanobacteria bacterium J06592_8]
MQNIILSSPEDVLSPIFPFLTLKIPGTPLTYLEASSFTSKLDCQNTIKGLANTSISCPSADSHLLRTYLSDFTFSTENFAIAQTIT